MSSARASLAVVVIFFTGLLSLTLAFLPEPAGATTLYVGGGGPGNYTTIQAAVNDSNPSDTIYVFSGVYHENVRIDKTLSLVGESRDTTLVNGTGTGDVIHISSSWVNMTGFTVTNSGPDKEDAGVEISDASNCLVSDVNTSNNNAGIYLHYSNNTTLTSNIALWSKNYGIWVNTSNDVLMTSNAISWSNYSGILLYPSRRAVLSNNTLTSNYVGIRTFYSSGNIVVGNNVSNNSEEGIGFVLSDSSYVANNTLWGNSVAISVSSTDNSTVTNNTAWSNSADIELFHADNNKIHFNTVANSGAGVWVYGSANNSITRNEIMNHSSGISLDESDGNTIADNNISLNTLWGIEFYDSIDNVVRNNTISLSNWSSIIVSYSDANIIADNVISKNSGSISLYSSRGVTVTNNTLVEGGILLDGVSLEHWNTHEIDTSNTVNGRPLRYWKNITGGIVPLDTGQVVLANCSGVTVENQSFNASGGILLGFANNITIANNTVSNSSWDGIYTWYSVDNSIMNNTISSNAENGISLDWAMNHTVIDNSAYMNTLSGIYAESGESIIVNNTLSDNRHGVHLRASWGLTILGNTMTQNGIYLTMGGLLYWNTHTVDTTNTVNGKPVYYWKNRTGGTIAADAGEVILANCTGVVVENLSLSNGSVGVELGHSSNNTIRNNTVSNNWMGLFSSQSENNSIYHNRFVDNTRQAFDDEGTNKFDIGYPAGGNYWSDYGGADLMWGPDQNITGSDGIGDTPYLIDADSQDRYPLMMPPPQPRTFTRLLPKGLNLVSFPLTPLDESVEAVLQTVKFDKAWTYDPLNQKWIWYMDFKAYKGDLTSINNTIGIWINVTEDSNLTVAGVIPSHTTIQLRKGWNLVGFPSFDSTYTVADLKGETGAMRVEGYDPSVPPYFLRVLADAETLQAGYGYWVRVESDITWIVSA